MWDKIFSPPTTTKGYHSKYIKGIMWINKEEKKTSKLKIEMSRT